MCIRDREWRVIIDGREIRTPSSNVLALPTEEMAWGIAAEWEEQSARVQPHTMPLMTLASTAIDQLPQIRPKMVNSMVRCLDADAACFRSQQPQLAAAEQRMCSFNTQDLPNSAWVLAKVSQTNASLLAALATAAQQRISNF